MKATSRAQSSDHKDDDVDSHHQRSNSKDSPTDTRRSDDAGGPCKLRTICSNLCADFYLPRRYIVVFLLFLGLCIVHAQRVNVGVAVVSIVDSRHRVGEFVYSPPADISDVSNTSAMPAVKHSVRMPIFRPRRRGSKLRKKGEQEVAIFRQRRLYRCSIVQFWH